MAHEWTEVNLIQGLRTGREEAVEALIDAYGDRLLRAILLLVRDRHLAEDLLQETIVAAVQGVKRFRGEAGLYAWLRGIAVNQCRMQLRKRFPLPLAETPSAEGRLDVEDEAIRNIEGRALTDAVFALPYVYREAVVLHYYLGMSVEEMSCT